MISFIAKKQSFILFSLLLLVEIALILACTSASVGISPDSIIYYGAARSLLAGRGLLMPYLDIPLTHFPPLYPLLLAAGGGLGLQLLIWAKWANIFFALCSLLTALLISRRLSAGWYLLPVLLIASSRSFTDIHVMAWSEPSYIFFTFASIGCLFLHLENPRPWLLATAGLLCGLAWLDRYIGLALLLAMGVVIWNNSRQRIKDLVLFGLPAALPMLIWLGFNALASGEAVDRQVRLLPITNVEAGITLGLALVGFAAYRYLRAKSASSLLTLLALYLFFYAALLGFTISLADPATLVLDFRILAPVFFCLYLLLVPFIMHYTQKPRLFLSVVGIIILLQVVYLVMFVQVVSVTGLVQATGEWRWEGIYIPPYDWQ